MATTMAAWGPEAWSERKEEPNFYGQSCVKEDGEVSLYSEGRHAFCPCGPDLKEEPHFYGQSCVKEDGEVSTFDGGGSRFSQMTLWMIRRPDCSRMKDQTLVSRSQPV
ncbi:hypothetical protein Bbelb_127920 [Branchiostoma belcheri]|nr:hypothetical protein Bbelb_127920 [Branchiostoma belcheri]